MICHPSVPGELPESESMPNFELLELGGESLNQSYDDIPTANRNEDYDDEESILLADPSRDGRPPPDRIGFVGLMQQLVFNRHEFFELAAAEKGRADNIETTAVIYESDGPITFMTPDSYLVTNMKIHSSTFSIYFQVG